MIAVKLRASIALVALVITITLNNCSSEDRDPYANKNSEEIYKEALTHLTHDRYEQAIKSYEALETHFPFGETTTKGQLEVLYAYYKNQEYIQATTAADRYLRLHPFSQYADYVHYIKGLCNFEQGSNLVTYLFNTKPELRDVSNFKSAFENFNTVVKQYPKSKYANDARHRMIFAKNIIAEHELSIAKYYVERKAYLAAANRARYILEHLENSPAEKPALNLIQDMYAKLNLTPLLNAENSEKALKLDRPELASLTLSN